MMKFRLVNNGDCRLLHKWVNDPEVRRMSFSSDPISWEEHCDWFKDKLKDPKCHFYIAHDENNNPLGQIRFDEFREGEVKVGVSIDSLQRRKGYGRQLIDSRVSKLFEESSIHTVHAEIKIENTESKMAFQKAGFEMSSECIIKCQKCVCYIRRKT